MPILKKGATPLTHPVHLSFVERMRAGRVVPVISDEVLFELVLGGHTSFTQGYADYIRYPLGDKGNLVRMAKFFQFQGGLGDQARKADYLNYLKNHIYDLAQQAGADPDLHWYRLIQPMSM